MNIVTQQAISAIGESSPNDWKLAPETHAKNLPAEARLLSEVLEAQQLKAIIENYSKFDQAAIRAQRVYKLQAKGAAIASFIVLVLGSVLVLPGYHFMSNLAITTVCTMQTILATISVLLLTSNEYRNPLLRWKVNRSSAEGTRISLFKTVMEAKEQGSRQPSEIPLLPLQLEYLRRYLLDSERKYYAKSSKGSARALRGARLWRLFALLMLLISGLPLLWEVRGHPWTPEFVNEIGKLMPEESRLGEHVFLGIFFAAVALRVLLDSYAVISLNYRDAWRYPVTAQRLDNLADRNLVDARFHAAAGEVQPVISFTALVYDVLLSEHREWAAIRAVVET